MIVSVAGGKGGVGKTSVALMLALGTPLAQLADCDVETPGCRWFVNPKAYDSFAVEVKVPLIDRKLCNSCGKCAQNCRFGALMISGGILRLFPELCHSCGGCALVCPMHAIHEIPLQVGEVMAGQGVGDYGHIHWLGGKLFPTRIAPEAVIFNIKEKLGGCDYTIVDSPAGSSSSAAAIMGSDACLLVTEPNAQAVRELEKSLRILEKLNFFRFGIVVNKSENGRWQAQIRQLAFRYEAPVIAEIPFGREWAIAYAEGRLPERAKTIGRRMWEEVRLTWAPR